MKLNYKQTIFCGFAFSGICAFWQLYDSVIPLILKFDFDIGDSAAGLIITLGNLSTVFLLPLFGSISDRTRTPFGKRMPYITCGTLIAAAAFAALPMASENKNLPMFLFFLWISIVAMGVYRSPAVSLMPDITPKPLRSKANAIINLMGTVGALAVLVLISKLMKTWYYVDCTISGASDTVSGSSILQYFCSGCNTEHILSEETRNKYVLRLEHESFLPLFVLTAIIMTVCLCVLVITVREKKLNEETAAIDSDDGVSDAAERRSYHKGLQPGEGKSLVLLLLAVSFCCISYNAITIAFSKYVALYWRLPNGGFANCLMVSLAAGTVANIPLGMFSEKIGRKKMLLCSTLLIGVMFGAVFCFRSYHPAVNVLFAFVGIAWAAFNINAYPMAVETCKGSDIGKYTGLYSLCLTSGRILSPVITGYILTVSYRSLFLYAAMMAFLSFAILLFVKHGNSEMSINQ